MVRYLLALKPSDPGSLLPPFFDTLRHGDSIFIFSVLQDIDDELFPHEMNHPWKELICRKEERRLKDIARSIAPNVNCSIVIHISNNFGLSVCNEAEKVNADFLVLCMNRTVFNIIRHHSQKKDLTKGLDWTPPSRTAWKELLVTF